MGDRTVQGAVGCWIDGHWGQYGSARLVELAAAHGFKLNNGEQGVLDRMMASMGPNPDMTRDHDWEDIHEIADEAEAWMNYEVAPDGHQFGWYDGEWFLWPNSEWEEIG